MVPGGNKVTDTTAVTRMAIAVNLTLFRVSLNKKYVAIIMKTVLKDNMAPTMPPLRPDLKAYLKPMVRPSAPRSSSAPPNIISIRSVLSVLKSYSP